MVCIQETYAGLLAFSGRRLRKPVFCANIQSILPIGDRANRRCHALKVRCMLRSSYASQNALMIQSESSERHPLSYGQ